MITHFTADTHLQHEGILDMQARPYPSIDAHDDAIVESFNRCVGKDDRLVILGDVAWRTVDSFLARLVCKNVHLIVGNHDKASYGKHFKSVADVGEFKIGEHKIFCSHYPHAYWPASHYGSIHLYGHVHGDREDTLDAAFPGRRSMDCGLDNAFNVFGERRPFHQQEILDLMLVRPGHDKVDFYKRKQETRLRKARACGFVPPTPGYAPCTRDDGPGHDGPCAHPLKMSFPPPHGLHDNGSITLGPEAARFLREAMARRGSRILMHPPSSEWLDQLAEIMWRTQNIGFEQNC